jgi:hypothetical protein
MWGFFSENHRKLEMKKSLIYGTFMLTKYTKYKKTLTKC